MNNAPRSGPGRRGPRPPTTPLPAATADGRRPRSTCSRQPGDQQRPSAFATSPITSPVATQDRRLQTATTHSILEGPHARAECWGPPGRHRRGGCPSLPVRDAQGRRRPARFVAVVCDWLSAAPGRGRGLEGRGACGRGCGGGLECHLRGGHLFDSGGVAQPAVAVEGEPAVPAPRLTSGRPSRPVNPALVGAGVPGVWVWAWFWPSRRWSTCGVEASAAALVVCRLVSASRPSLRAAPGRASSCERSGPGRAAAGGVG